MPFRQPELARLRTMSGRTHHGSVGGLVEAIYALSIPMAEKRRLAYRAVADAQVTLPAGTDVSDTDLRTQYEQLLDRCRHHGLIGLQGKPSVGVLSRFLATRGHADLARSITHATRGRHARAHYRRDLLSNVDRAMESIGRGASSASSAAGGRASSDEELCSPPPPTGFAAGTPHDGGDNRLEQVPVVPESALHVPCFTSDDHAHDSPHLTSEDAQWHFDDVHRDDDQHLGDDTRRRSSIEDGLHRAADPETAHEALEPSDDDNFYVGALQADSFFIGEVDAEVQTCASLVDHSGTQTCLASTVEQATQTDRTADAFDNYDVQLRSYPPYAPADSKGDVEVAGAATQTEPMPWELYTPWQPVAVRVPGSPGSLAQQGFLQDAMVAAAEEAAARVLLPTPTDTEVHALAVPADSKAVGASDAEAGTGQEDALSEDLTQSAVRATDLLVGCSAAALLSDTRRRIAVLNNQFCDEFSSNPDDTDDVPWLIERVRSRYAETTLADPVFEALSSDLVTASCRMARANLTLLATAIDVDNRAVGANATPRAEGPVDKDAAHDDQCKTVVATSPTFVQSATDTSSITLRQLCGILMQTEVAGMEDYIWECLTDEPSAGSPFAHMERVVRPITKHMFMTDLKPLVDRRSEDPSWDVIADDVIRVIAQHFYEKGSFTFDPSSLIPKNRKTRKGRRR